jgi:hypothetical protein
MSLRDLIEGEAIMDDDDEEVADDYDAEGRQGAGTTNHYDDSSEEEDEEEDDEEAARAVSFDLHPAVSLYWWNFRSVKVSLWMRTKKTNVPLANIGNVRALLAKKSTLMKKIWNSLDMVQVNSVDQPLRYVGCSSSFDKILMLWY